MVFLVLFFLGICVPTIVKTSGHWNESYHNNSDFQNQLGRKIIDDLEFKGAEKVLDVGCGTGRISHYCAQRLATGSVLGIDSSQDMINFAQTEYLDSKNLSFVSTDVTKMDHENEFDIIYSLFCLHWVKEQKQAIQNIYHALKPGGKSFLCICCENNLTTQWNKATQKAFEIYPELLSKHVEDVPHQPFDEWIERVKDVGMIVLGSSLDDRTKVFSSVQEMKAFISALNIESNLSPSERSVFLDAALEELYELYGLSINDPFAFTTTILTLKLNKPN